MSSVEGATSDGPDAGCTKERVTEEAALKASSVPAILILLACASEYPDLSLVWLRQDGREDVAVVCALVLLLRLGRFPEPDGFAELRPLFRCNALLFRDTGFALSAAMA